MYRMKKTILILIMISFEVCYSQEQGINKLTEIKEELVKKNQMILDSIKMIDLVINNIKVKEKKNKDSLFVATIIKNGKILNKPSRFSDVVLNIPEELKVLLFDYSNGFFGVCTDSICGYVDGIWVKTTPELISFMSANNSEINDVKKTEKENIKKYGKTNYDKLKKGYYWIGMTKYMALISLGHPKEINRTVGSWGVHEQWVYDGKYYYFENGKMTSFQD